MQQLIDGYLFTDDQALILSKAAEVHAFMQQAYWTKGRTEAATRAGLVHSWNFALFEPGTGRLVGFARVISDYATMYYLSDVFVAPDCRGKGLGKAMVHWIAEEDPRFIHVTGLLKTRDAKGFYERFGFEECPVHFLMQPRL